ncbi:putative membrane protein [uncultured Gammaproteobacteria bacterium]
MTLWISAIAALVVMALALDAVDLMGRAFAAGTLPGLVVAALLAMTVGSTLKLALDEMTSLRRMRRVESLRAEAERLETGGGYGHGAAFAERLSEFYRDRTDLDAAFVILRRSLTDAHDDAEVVKLIDRQILVGIDQRAYRSVVKAARDSAIATALSPSAALDVVIVLWRNLKLVRDLAALYGARPGPVGSARLLRRMFASVAVAGVAESASHVAVDALGGTLAAAVSARLGQGMINGLLTARVGLATMHLCRPTPFGTDNQPSLKRIRSELMTVHRQVL